MKLEQLISHLLLRHNCVVVPGFGGFVASRQAAKIDPRGNMHPPYKAVLFNKQLINNDGLLIHAFANLNNLPFEQAQLDIKQTIASWQDELQSGNRINFDQLGFIYFDDEKNLRFEQDRFHNLLLESFGLSTVRFISEQTISTPVKVVQESVSKQTETIKESPAVVISLPKIGVQKTSGEKTAEPAKTKIRTLEPAALAVEKKSSNRKLIKYIAAACLLPIAFYTFWIPMKTDVLESGMISAQDFNPFRSQGKATYVPLKKASNFEQAETWVSLEKQVNELPNKVEHYSFDLFENNKYLTIQLEKETSQDDLEAVEPKTASTPKPEQHVSIAASVSTKPKQTGSFQVVVGSFSNAGNAEQLIADLNKLGYQAYPTQIQNGLTRVCAGRFENVQEAQQAVKRLAGQDKNSWILK